MSWTIQTTAAEDEAITFAYQQSQKPGMIAPVPGETVQAFFDRMTHTHVISGMTSQHLTAKNAELVTTLNTIPPANREAAKQDIDAVVVQHGGTVALKTAVYKWSKSSAPPPSANSVEMNVNDASVATVSKLYFHYLDAHGTDRMTQLLAVPANTAIRIEDAVNASTFLQVITTGAGIQRQGANGHVEFPVKYSLSAAAFTPLDTHNMNVLF